MGQLQEITMACIQSVTMFWSEQRGKGDHVRGTISLVNELQLLVNQEERATTGCFRTTSLGAPTIESGLRAAIMQLENRQSQFALRRLVLPQGNQAREIVGTRPAVGRQLTDHLAYTEGTEGTIPLEEHETLDADLL